MHLPAKDSSYCHQTLPTGIHPIIPAIDTLSSFRNQFDQIPWATGSIKIYPAKEGAYRHRCSEDDGEPGWRVMRSSKGSWRPVAWRVEAVEGPEAVGARPRSPTTEELACHRRAGAGRGAPGACVVGARGPRAGRRAPRAGVGGRGTGGGAGSVGSGGNPRQPDGVGGRRPPRRWLPCATLQFILGIICRGGSWSNRPYKYIFRGGSWSNRPYKYFF